MQALIRTMAFAATLAIAPGATAALSVDSMNFPAWVERGEQTMPLAPGDRLDAGDIVVTGRAGRAWLAVEDGSVIKLGQGSRFVVNMAGFRSSGNQTVLEAAFDVLEGAFRFTSSFFRARRSAAHEVEFRVGAITAGVRGTDIWGRSASGEDFVALLEGSIEASSEGDAPRLMEQALTLYRKADGRPADGIAPVDISVVQELALETELSADAGIAAADGAFDLVLGSVPARTFDAQGLERFRRAGFPVSAKPALVGGIQHTRIVLGGFVDLEAADNQRRTIAARFGIDDAWIVNRN